MKQSLFSGCSGYPGERLEAFSGWLLPAWIDSPVLEMRRVREGGGFFDGSPWTKILVAGREGLDLLQRISTNDLNGLGVGRVKPTILVTEKGRLIDLLHVIPLDRERTLLIGTPGRGDIIQWLEKFTIAEEITYTDVTHDYPMVLTIGAEAKSRLSSLLGASVGPDASVAREVSGVSILCASSSGLPFDISFALQLSGAVTDFWSLLMSDPTQMRACGFHSFKYARIRNGVPLAQELHEEYNPYDIGLRGAISYSKGCYIGQEVIARLDTYEKIRREPILLSTERRISGEGAMHILKEGEVIGVLTSVCEDRDEVGHPAIGIVARGRCRAGDEVSVGVELERAQGRVRASLEGGSRWV